MIVKEIHICDCIGDQCYAHPTNRLFHVDDECVHLDGTKHKIPFKKNPNHEIYKCFTCESEVVIYWDPKYNGMRGRCYNCDTDWAES